LVKGGTILENVPDGEDVTLMLHALRKLGVTVLGLPSIPDVQGITIIGNGLIRAPNGEVDLFLGNSGTATRILTALLTAGDGNFLITGVERMYERPIGDLVDALRPLCGETKISYDGKVGFPPLRIEARGLAGGKTSIRGNLSSQFVTGLLMAMPLCKNRVEVGIEGTLVSAPYVDLTLHVMRDFGAKVERDGYKKFLMEKPSGYPGRATRYVIEPDASSASYFLAAGAIAQDFVTIKGLRKKSPQGEAKFAEVLGKMGARVDYKGHQPKVDLLDDDGDPVYTSEDVIIDSNSPLRGIDTIPGYEKGIDMDLMSDTGMTLAVIALFAEGKTTIRNVGNWRLKETDRLRAMATELRKLGAEVEEGADWISIVPPEHLTPNVEIDTYDDHSMAMCFSLVSLGPNGVRVVIKDPACVKKTYPGYWREFGRMTGQKLEVPGLEG
jgi:3-phosphoshikimate 1-carboxyvinyltransferase